VSAVTRQGEKVAFVNAVWDSTAEPRRRRTDGRGAGNLSRPDRDLQLSGLSTLTPGGFQSDILIAGSGSRFISDVR